MVLPRTLHVPPARSKLLGERFKDVFVKGLFFVVGKVTEADSRFFLVKIVADPDDFSFDGEGRFWQQKRKLCLAVGGKKGCTIEKDPRSSHADIFHNAPPFQERLFVFTVKAERRLETGTLSFFFHGTPVSRGTLSPKNRLNASFSLCRVR
jgi:hypothetical protein